MGKISNGIQSSRYTTSPHLYEDSLHLISIQAPLLGILRNHAQAVTMLTKPVCNQSLPDIPGCTFHYFSFLEVDPAPNTTTGLLSFQLHSDCQFGNGGVSDPHWHWLVSSLLHHHAVPFIHPVRASSTIFGNWTCKSGLTDSRVFSVQNI